MSNPSCLQTGAACRYADVEGQVHDAVITAVVSLQYDEGYRASVREANAKPSRA